MTIKAKQSNGEAGLNRHKPQSGGQQATLAEIELGPSWIEVYATLQL
jgi:hypothetical protein